MRLEYGGAYTSDIRALRSRIRANGTNAVIAPVTVTHPRAVQGAAVDVHINLAYQANSAFPAVNGSLYVVGFGNANGIWHFNGLGVMGAPLPGAAFPGGQTGDYAGLGYAHGFPQITDANLGNAVTALNAYNGGATAGIRPDMVRLIIAVCEAARLGPIERGVNSVLGNQQAYAPNWDEIHNWGGNRLGD